MSAKQPRRTSRLATTISAATNEAAEKPQPSAPPKQPGKSAESMFFMVAKIGEAARAGQPTKFLAMHRREIYERASLLRRLGYSRDEVQRRLEGYETWEYEPFHMPRLRAEVAQIVASVYESASMRTTSLSPES